MKELSDEDRQAALRLFEKRRAKRLGGFAVAAVMALCMMILPEEWTFPFGKAWPPMPIFVLPPIIIYWLVIWRCPVCNAYLGRTINPRECPVCRTSFR
jgi:rubrerythrin